MEPKVIKRRALGFMTKMVMALRGEKEREEEESFSVVGLAVSDDI